MNDRLIDRLLSEYGESHQNATNKSIHWICVPVIMFSLFGLLMAIPFPAELSVVFNWASPVMVLAMLYYIRLSWVMFFSFLIIGGLIIWGNYALYAFVDFKSTTMALTSLGLFAAAWVGQFIGHNIEGKKPSFIKDVQFLLVGPAWLLHFIFKKLNISY